MDDIYHLAYKNDKNFKLYVDKYCKTYRYSLEEALQHKTVHDVYEYYQEKENENDSKYWSRCNEI